MQPYDFISQEDIQRKNFRDFELNIKVDFLDINVDIELNIKEDLSILRSITKYLL